MKFAWIESFASFAALAPLGLCLCVSPSSTVPTRLVSVDVLSDRLQPMAGAIVQVESSSGSVVGVTDVEGQTPWFALDAAGGVDLTLVERTTAQGIALGMQERVVPPVLSSTNDDFQLTSISRTQPLAVPVAIEADKLAENTLYPPAGDHAHWVVVVPKGSPALFTLHIASLIDAGAIDEFFDYRGLAPAPDYMRGVDLVVGNVELDSAGLVVGLDLLGDLTGGCVIDAYNFTNASNARTAQPVQVTQLNTVDGIVFVRIIGKVASGHLTLVARRAGGKPAQSRVLLDAPPSVAVPPSTGQGVDTAWSDCGGCGSGGEASAASSTTSMVQDCEPPTPEPPANWSCDPPAPDASPSCSSVVTPGAKQCVTSRSRSPRFCRSPGGSVSGSTARTKKWKASFTFTGAQGTALSSGGGFEYGIDESSVLLDAWTAQAGAHGKGQCMRYYQFELACSQLFVLERPEWSLIEGWLDSSDCVSSIEVASCTDAYTSQSTCDRTP